METPPTLSDEDTSDDLTFAIERAYQLILGRPVDAAGLEWYQAMLRSGDMSLAEVCAALASSEEFTRRLEPPQARRGDVERERLRKAREDPNWVDVAELIKTVSVEDLAKTAEGYFRAVENPDLLLSKPFSDLAETPELLVTFGQVLRGLRPLPGMRVLDFGAGTCWTSRFLTQVGCRVTALDVSPTALELGRRLYREMPVIGTQPEPEFLVYDGYRIDLPDGSMDRILSFDAFHHVPNPADVLREMARVLRPGGIAAFSEPNDRHSVTPQSQYEMRNYGIIENDIIIEDVWKWAEKAGFVEMRLCLLDSAPQWVDVDTFNDVIADREPEEVFSAPTRAGISYRRMFWLQREGTEIADSREAKGLVAELSMTDVEIDTSGPVTVVSGTCSVRNPGPRAWLASDAEFGPVSLGVRVHLADQTVRDLSRIPLPGNGIAPGDGVIFPFRAEIPAQPEGAVAVEFDLISELVCWFSANGSPVARFPLT